MNNDIVIVNNTQYLIDEIVLDLCNDALSYLQLSRVSLAIILVSDEEIFDLNKTYRNKEAVTDVITFAYEDVDNFNQLFNNRELGDMFIALDYVYKSSVRIGHSMYRELSFVIVHGLLHMLGYDHQTNHQETEMFKLQEEVITSIMKGGVDLNAIFDK